MNEKIAPEHLQRRAAVYIRQSTAEQVRVNTESQRRQYQLADKARQMGWTEVEVIDDDLGQSAAGSARRVGFQRLVAAVCLQEVGAVFCMEASRLARNNRDWTQLVDLCGLAGTLIVDFDGVYDPGQLNDRLLLGLKGTMSEFELGLMRQRSLEALRSLAARGELVTTLPVGYVRQDRRICEKDPDRRVEHALRTLFEKFRETGSIRQTLLWFRQEGVTFPVQDQGASGHQVVWRLPLYGTLHKVLTNPIYAGSYAYGRTYTRTTTLDGQMVKTRGHRRSQEEWQVLLHDHHEPYISWEEFEHNQGVIAQNAAMRGAMTRGPVRTGNSLAAGLLRCRRCGRRLHVSYSGTRSNVPRYSCRGAHINHGEAACLSFGGLAFDRALEQEVLRVLEPAAIEAAVGALRDETAGLDQKREALRFALQHAEYEADRARRQYDAVEPENRLVAGELENRWNQALAKVDRLRSQWEATAPKDMDLSAQEEKTLLELAQEFPAVWSHPDVDMRTKKRIVRTLVSEVVVDVDDEAHVIRAVVHWAGGVHSELVVKKHRTGQHRYSTDHHVVDLVQQLTQVASDKDIARILNRLGLKTGKGQSWIASRVNSLRAHRGIPTFSPERQQREGWLNMSQAAEALGVSAMTVRRLLQRKILKGSQIVPYAPWTIRQEDLRDPSVQAAVEAIRRGRKIPLPQESSQGNLDFIDIL